MTQIAARARVLAVFAAVLSAASCSSPKTTATISWTLTPASSAVGPATLTLSLHDPAGSTITGAKLRIEAYMSHPGMKPVVVEAEEPTPGVYVAPVIFSMAGDWVLLVSATLTDGGRVEHQIDVANVRP